MNHDVYDDSYIRRILKTVRTVAMIGVSRNESRPSYFVSKYLIERGYRVIPVNPGLAGQTLLGQTVYPRLSDIPEPVDMVDIFRASQFVAPIVAEATAIAPRPRVIWMQIGVRDDEAARLAEANGMTVVMNRCPKIELRRGDTRQGDPAQSVLSPRPRLERSSSTAAGCSRRFSS